MSNPMIRPEQTIATIMHHVILAKREDLQRMKCRHFIHVGALFFRHDFASGSFSLSFLSSFF